MGLSVGIFGGSFDPIHNGHLNLAAEMMEARGLDEVWFIPAGYSPFKNALKPVSEEARFKMVQLAIKGESRFRALDLEICRNGPSYTVDTLQTLTEAFKDEDISFFLILGKDAARGFCKWKEPEKIVSMAQLLVGSRGEESGSGEQFKGQPSVTKALREGITPTRIMDISSTDVRRRLSEGKFCGHLVPGKVLDYIFAHQLYCVEK